MKKKKTKKKLSQYSMGTGKTGLVRNYIESPNQTLVENDIAMAKAREEAANNPWANGLNIAGTMAMQYGLNKAGGAGGAGKGLLEGFGNIFGGQQQMATGGEVGGPGKKKSSLKRVVKHVDSIEERDPGLQITPMINFLTGENNVPANNKMRDLTPEEQAEIAAQTEGLTGEAIQEIFGVGTPQKPNYPKPNLGKYEKVGYFDVVDNNEEGFQIVSTDKNPHSRDTLNPLLDYIRKQNPNRKVTFASGGSVGKNVNVEIEGDEVGELPNGEMFEAKGPSHENGGIDVNLPEGTEIFSKRIKVANKSMAERKKAREKRVNTLEKLLAKNSTDKALKNSLQRTIAANEKEEAKDQQLQEMIGGMQEMMQLAYGTGNAGVKSMANGGTVVGDLLRNLFGGKQEPTYNEKGFRTDLTNFSSDNASLDDGILDTTAVEGINSFAGQDSVLPGEKQVNGDGSFLDSLSLPNVKGGDLVSMAGNLYSTFAPMKNTQANRAGDTPNINAYEDFGNDALDKIQSAKGLAGQSRDNALEDLETSRVGATNRNRNSARGVNQMRALDIATQSQTNRAQNQVHDNFAKMMMNLYGQEANFENVQDQMVMQGEQARDLADRQDRDNYYTQMAQDISTKGQGIQQIGKDLNAVSRNSEIESLLEQLSKHGYKLK